MAFPTYGHTRTRGMFRTLDTPGDVLLAPTRFSLPPLAPVAPAEPHAPAPRKVEEPR